MLPYLDGTVDIVVVASADAGADRRGAPGRRERRDQGRSERLSNGRSSSGPGGAPRGWGEDVVRALLPDANGSPWDATAGAFAETARRRLRGRARRGRRRSIERWGRGRAGRRRRCRGCGRSRPRPERASRSAPVRRSRPPTRGSTSSSALLRSRSRIGCLRWSPSSRRSRDAGVVGARILADDGSLEAAGGLLGPDGSPRRRGRGGSRSRPARVLLRASAWTSARRPLLATRRERVRAARRVRRAWWCASRRAGRLLAARRAERARASTTSRRRAS